MRTSASKRTHGAITSTISTSPPRLPRNTRRKLTPPAEESSNSSPLSSSSVVSSSSSSDGGSPRSESPSDLPEAPQASLHSRLRSFLPQLAAANASLSEAGIGAPNFELEAVAVEKAGDEVEGDEVSNTRKKQHVRKVKDVSEVSRGDASSNEEGEEEDAPYIEMNLDLGVLQALEGERCSTEPFLLPLNDNDSINAEKKKDEPAVMEELLGQRPAAKRKAIISEVE